MRTFKKMVLVAFVALLPVAVSAAVFEGAEEYYTRGATVDGNLYVGAGSAVIGSTIKGDLLIGAGNVVVTEDVEKDVFVAGGSVNLLGNIGEDLRVAGGNITIEKNIGGDILAFGGAVHILSQSTVNGDVFIAGGKVIIDGTVNGNVRIFGGEVNINGNLKQNTKINFEEKFVMGSTAVLDGDLTYTAPRQFTQEDGSVIKGKITFNEIAGKRFDRGFFFALVSAAWGIQLIITLFAGLLAILFLRRFSKTIAEEGFDSWGKNAFIGFCVLFLAPILVVLLFATIIGILPALIVLFIYGALLFLARVFAGIIFGLLLHRLISKNHTRELSWKNGLGGILLLHVLTLVPFIGWIIALFFFLVSFGTVSKVVYGVAKREK